MNRLTREGVTPQGDGSKKTWESQSELEAAAAGWPLLHMEGAEAQMVHLVRAIEAEIIPRLMLAHRTESVLRVSPPTARSALFTEEVAEFSRLVLGHDVEVASAYVDALRTSGMKLETLYIHVLAPTARRLGNLWEEDLCDYTTVALGLWRLQQVLRESSPEFLCDAESRSCGRKALLASAPGEQHMLGVYMVSEFFRCVASEMLRRDGWDVWGAPPASRDELMELVGVEWFDIVELSATCEGRLDVLTEDIRAIRNASRNREIVVHVGGPVFDDNPDCAGLVGADARSLATRPGAVDAQELLEAVSGGVGKGTFV